MPTKKEQRDYVNPRLLLRGVMKSLPAVEYVRPTVVALWAHSNNFLEKDDVANGTVSFSGTVSYGQLADFCGIDYETAKWRMKQLRDKHELVEWERFKLGIKFTFGVRLSGNGLTEVMDYLSASGLPAGCQRDSSSQVTKESSQVTEQSSQVMDGVESGNRLPPLAFDLAHLAKVTGSVVTGHSLRSADPKQYQEQQPGVWAEVDSLFPQLPVNSAAQLRRDSAAAPAPAPKSYPPKPGQSSHHFHMGTCLNCLTRWSLYEKKREWCAKDPNGPFAPPAAPIFKTEVSPELAKLVEGPIKVGQICEDCGGLGKCTCPPKTYLEGQIDIEPGDEVELPKSKAFQIED